MIVRAGNQVPLFTMYTLKKALGQHFLKDQSVVNRILDALTADSFDRLLEVGPGGGALTAALLQLPSVDFKAVEVDAEKVNYLQATYPSISSKLIQGSMLDMDCPFAEPFTVIGNFPYNISTQILFKILDWKERVPVVIGMFQKEVAERAASKEGSKVYGVLSALVQADYDVTLLFDVPPEAFRPPPKVMSSVIRLSRRQTELPYRSRKTYHLLVKQAFGQRRKTLRNAVRGLFDAEVLQDPLFDRRAETLSIGEFAALTHRMKA